VDTPIIEAFGTPEAKVRLCSTITISKIIDRSIYLAAHEGEGFSLIHPIWKQLLNESSMNH
jgi:hypothetical protein